MEEESKPKYIFKWTDEERDRYSPIIEAVKSGNRAEVEKAAHQLTIDQFAIPPEDTSLLPQLPRWVTDEALQGKDDHEYDFRDTVIVLIPPKKLIKRNPTSEFFKDTKPGSKPVWFKIKYDDEGLTSKGEELVDWYRGVPPEMQDSTDNADLN